jgi:hypothetical protein
MPTSFRRLFPPLTAFVVLAMSLPTPACASNSLSVIETDESICITQGSTTVLKYIKVSPSAPPEIDTIYERSGCLHPVNSPSGRSVTAMFPVDHAHQHGVFSAWVKTTYDGREIDFWNLARRTGRVLHDRVFSVSQAETSAGFEVDLTHRIVQEPAVDVLRERWKVTVHATDGTYHLFDLVTTQKALTEIPLWVNQYHYGGMALRGPTRWLTGKDNDVRTNGKTLREPSGFLNSLGSLRKEGNHQHARWVSLWGLYEGQPVSVSVLCHADNFRAPQAARLHPTKPYFCFAPCVDGEFIIDQAHPFTSQYRYLVTDGKPDPKWLDAQWHAWCGQP